MSNVYLLITDTYADLPVEYYREHNIPTTGGSVQLGDRTYIDDAGQTLPHKEFYDAVRAGAMPSTSMINTTQYIDLFEPPLQQGQDILYLAFTSGLSGSYFGAVTAANELMEKYPGRTIAVVDTLCASLGQGLLVHEAAKRYEAGMPLGELHKWCEDNKLRVHHIVVAEDLMHLCRGGRVSKTSAVLGSMIGIKPLIILNVEGKLQPVGKIRGRKAALQNYLARIKDLTQSKDLGDIAICHSDCVADAERVRDIVATEYNIGECIINYVGPAIGSHTGVGTVSLFFLGNPRVPVD